MTVGRPPSAHYQAEVDAGNISQDTAQLTALVALDSLFDALSRHRDQGFFSRFRTPVTPTGLYLWGGVGTGKTLLMDMFYRALPAGMARRVHFHRFMQWVHDERREIRDQQNPLGIIVDKLAARHRVLCLDEFAVTDITDAMILHGLLRALFGKGMTLITTSNIPRRDLYRDGLQRDRFQAAIELLEAHTTEINVDSGNDYRTAFLKDDSIYHTPIDRDAERALAACFERLSALHEESKTEIDIHGRKVEVVATGSGVVWFDFAVLCEGHRSKMDYIELSKRFHTLILANIPVLDDDQRDATRRLIELVDELYDRGVNLIVSAAAEPDRLYRGKKLAAPFERTISRFREMSSSEYLGRPHLP